MKRYENECCDCKSDGYPCLGTGCPNRHVTHYYCDECEEEFEPSELYDYDGDMLCEECLLKQFKTIEEKGC